jgi:hypothetical protein
MPAVEVELTYTKLDSGAANAIDMVNTDEEFPMEVVFSATLPAEDSIGYPVPPGDGVVRNGHSGDMYARVFSRTERLTAFAYVGE